MNRHPINWVNVPQGWLSAGISAGDSNLWAHSHGSDSLCLGVLWWLDATRMDSLWLMGSGTVEVGQAGSQKETPNGGFAMLASRAADIIGGNGLWYSAVRDASI